MLEGAAIDEHAGVDQRRPCTGAARIAVAEIKSREIRGGRLYVSLTQSDYRGERRMRGLPRIAVAVVLCALVLARELRAASPTDWDDRDCGERMAAAI